VAQLASVLAWGASGRPFESDHPDADNQRVGAFLALCFFSLCIEFAYNSIRCDSTKLIVNKNPPAGRSGGHKLKMALFKNYAIC